MIEFKSRWSQVVAERHGRKKGWLYGHFFFLIYKLGGMQAFTNIEWQRIQRLVYVCQGNICRSPYAEARTRRLGMATSSFGLDADGEAPVDQAALENARRRSLDLSQHRSRTRSLIRFDASDLLIGMEPWHGKQLRKLAEIHSAQVTLLGLWGKEPRPYIQDPFGLNNDYFQTCFAQIDARIEAVLRRLSIDPLD